MVSCTRIACLHTCMKFRNQMRIGESERKHGFTCAVEIFNAPKHDRGVVHGVDLDSEKLTRKLPG